MKIFFALIGDPSIYEEVNYVLDGKLFKERSSISVFLKKFKFDKVFVFAPESLFNIKIKDYGSNFDYVKEGIKNFFEKEGIKENLEVVVTLSSGTYKDKESKFDVSFESHFSNYYYFLIKKFYDIFIDVCFNNEDKEIEIYLDITHGFNAFIAFFQLALLEFLEIVAMFKKVKILIYNSDPYSRFIKKNLNINLIRELEIKPIPYYKKTGSNDLDVFLGAIYNGLPLVLLNYFPDIENLEREINSKFNSFNEVRIEKNENEIKVIRKGNLDKNFQGKVISLFLAKALNKYFSITFKENLDFKIENYNYLYSRDINALKKFFGFDERIGIRIGKDIGNLIRSLKNNFSRIDRETILARLINNNTNPKFNERNFLAHSGFEYNSILIRKVRNIIYLRYDENYKKEIEKAAKRGLLD
jgi:CRISPR-associated protein Csx1